MSVSFLSSDGDGIYMKTNEQFKSNGSTEFAKIPNNVRDEIENFERKIPDELRDIEWEKVSKSPLLLVKIRNISRNSYEGNFSAIFTKSKNGDLKTFHESLKCRGRGYMMRCTNFTSTCRQQRQYESCITNASSIRRLESSGNNFHILIA